jgi:hypothetical protein
MGDDINVRCGDIVGFFFFTFSFSDLLSFFTALVMKEKVRKKSLLICGTFDEKNTFD